MASVSEHYESHLALHYSWLFGDFATKCRENDEFFHSHDIKPVSSGVAVDLGCGPGFQSIPLAEIGFEVISIDVSEKLLDELNSKKSGLPITTVKDDVLNFENHCPDNIELCICMGDTLTHLVSTQDVRGLIERVYRSLSPGGLFVLTFRDYTTELLELDRFIPVNSDESKLFTCFLEYEKETVNVYDIVYEKEQGKWHLKKSFYRKLRISLDLVVETLEEDGFFCVHSGIDKGMITIIARK